jgi:acyl dehydratase
MTTTIDLADLGAHVGDHLGYSPWLEISQQMVNDFAEVTGDHQWIHVDPERAAKGPFGGPIAHGYLTLSLAPFFLPQIWDVSGTSMGVNYGAEKIRFPAPVPVGSNLRAGAVVKEVKEIEGGAQVTLTVTFEVEGKEKPSLVADVVYRYYS